MFPASLACASGYDARGGCWDWRTPRAFPPRSSRSCSPRVRLLSFLKEI